MSDYAYTNLTAEDRGQIAQNIIRDFEAQHEAMRLQAMANEGIDDQAVQQARERMTAIRAAIARVRREAEGLDDGSPRLGLVREG